MTYSVLTCGCRVSERDGTIRPCTEHDRHPAMTPFAQGLFELGAEMARATAQVQPLPYDWEKEYGWIDEQCPIHRFSGGQPLTRCERMEGHSGKHWSDGIGDW